MPMTIHINVQEHADATASVPAIAQCCLITRVTRRDISAPISPSYGATDDYIARHRVPCRRPFD